MPEYLLKPDTRDLRDYTFRSSQFAKMEHLPDKVDLRPMCSPVVDQGKLGSCTANAIVGLREYMLIRDKEPFTRLSRLFLYYQERALEGTIQQDHGASIRDGMRVLNMVGVCPETDEPYEIDKFKQPPTDQDLKDAAKYKIGEYHRVTSLAILKAALAEGSPVVTGIYVYRSFESPAVSKTGFVSVPNIKQETYLGGHAVLVVGYDDSKEVCIVRNSWGSAWGDQGYCYLPYKYFTPWLVFDMWTSKG